MHSGTANNAGAILVVGRGLVVVPKLIHPLPPPVLSPETSPERVLDDTWMQVRFLLPLSFFFFLFSILNRCEGRISLLCCWKHAFVLIETIHIMLLLLLVPCRSSIFKDHQLQLVVVHNLTMTGAHLLIYDVC